MYIFDKNNFINEFIGFEFVEVFSCIAAIMAAYYLCRVYRDKLYIVVIAYFTKIVVINGINQILAYKLMDSDVSKIYVNLINLFFSMMMLAAVKLACPAKMSEIILMSMLLDVIGIFCFMGPYYIIRHFISNDQIYFYNSPNVGQSILLISVLLLVYIAGLLLLRVILRKVSKYYRIKRKISAALTYIVFGIVLLASFANYRDVNVYKNGNLIVLFIMIVVFGVTIPYLASVYSRKLEEKQELKRKDELLKEKETIEESSSEKLTEDDRKFRHDIDKHMNVIKEMSEEGASEEEIKEYASKIKETYK